MAIKTPHEVAVDLEACAFAVANLPAPYTINRHGVVMGEIAWDDCQCGQLVIAETRRYPSVAFPIDQVDHTAECGAPWLVVQYTMSLTRCIPTVTNDGTAPAISALQASASRNSQDMTNVRHAVLCCLDEWYRTHQVTAFELGAMEVTGPNGACGGFDFTILVGWTNDCGCGE